MLVLDSLRRLHHFVDIGVEVRDETVDLAHHAVTRHLLILLSLLEEATEASHYVTACRQLARLLHADINRHIIDTRAGTNRSASSTLPDLIVLVLDKRSLQLVSDKAGGAG